MAEIAGYTNLEVIGRGGFAVVYKARQVSVGRDVAIKLLTDPSPDDDLIRRFKRESRAVGALSWHPHIAAVVDAGSTEAGQAYIVFELLSGGSLEERIAHEPMAWNEAVSAMIQVSDAVEAAHRADVLHRDIKPANILLDRLGVAKLGDFGIASMQDGNKTETGMLATTIAHAAPELFDAQPASAATDVYALGSTLHTLVVGTAPFLPEGSERISTAIGRIINEPPPRPDPARVPEQVGTVIAHALAKQPQYRPRSAAAFGQALQQVQRDLGQPVTSMPVTDKEPKPPPSAVSTPNPAPAAPLPPSPVPVAPPPASPATSPGSAATGPSTSGSPAAGSSSPEHPPVPVSSIPASPAFDSGRTDTASRKPFGRTIAALSVIAVLLAAGVAGLLLFQAQRTETPLAVTEGGARILTRDGLDATTMAAPFGDQAALDRNEATYWGVEPGGGIGIVGTSYLITLTEAQNIVSVGISNGQSTELGRVSGLLWGTSIEELENRGPSVLEQMIPDEPGPHTMAYSIRTDRLVLAITGVHGDALNAGLAEILIEVESEDA